MKRAIEESFPIVEINRLAVPERNAFKPIYSMHKWFARRASCVFRAILLGCLKPAGTDVMKEYYKNHSDDPDTKGKVILDPFMGGGTTVVEALRLGCKVTGVDLNPVAWFVVKTEAEPVVIEELEAAFERLADRKVEWSGKSVRETVLGQYKTECPCCGDEADIIYTFWAKSAVCHNEKCPARSHGHGVEVPLFSDYIVAQKTPSIRYCPDVRCPKCKKTFDWESEPATLIADPKLMCSAGASAGELRGNVRWAYSPDSKVKCPWCAEIVNPLPDKKPKRERKKVPQTVLLCPECESVWQWRGDLPDDVKCPACKKQYNPKEGNAREGGKFICHACGTRQAVIDSIRRLPKTQPLPTRAYAITGCCERCNQVDEDEGNLFDEKSSQTKNQKRAAPHKCMVGGSGKFFKRVTPSDHARYQATHRKWEQEKKRLPYPTQEIPEGYNTNQMRKHNYLYWHQMFNSRQLLCHSTLLDAINAEPNQVLKEMLLNAFSNMLDSNCTFAFYPVARQCLARLFTRHDFQPRMLFVENNPWGQPSAGYTFPSFFQTVLEGKGYAIEPYELQPHPTKEGSAIKVRAGEPLPTTHAGDVLSLNCQSSEALDFLETGSVNFVITDPPYAGNVNYSELADFFYVWLRLALSKKYPAFSPELTPKAAEIIENDTRGKTVADFEAGLATVFRECYRVLNDDGVLAFTFHHAEGSAWEAVLESLQEAGFYILAAYPVHADAFHSESIGALGISYDLIHVCKKRDGTSATEQRSWAGIRQEIRRRARAEIEAIEKGRYGQEPLIPADVNIVLIGKCLELYSRHYGAVVDHDGRSVKLHEALTEIRSMVDDLVAKDHPLPSELEDIDAASRIYLLTLSASPREIKSDDLHKSTRGVLEPDDLLQTGLIIKGRAKRGRTYEVKQPAERFSELSERFQHGAALPEKNLFGEEEQSRANSKTLFIDHVHFLMGLADAGENLRPWLERFRGLTPQIRAACQHLKKKQEKFAPACNKILRFMEVDPLFK